MPTGSCAGPERDNAAAAGGAGDTRSVESGGDPAATAGGAADSALVSKLAAGTPSSEVVAELIEPWTGDLDDMVERRYIRVLVTFSRTNFFLDGAEQRGITHDALQIFERELNQKLGRGILKVHVIPIPVSRDELLSGLVDGRGDIAAANLTITAEREETVDFSLPLLEDVSEIVVTGPGAPGLTSLNDLAGREVHVRESSSYHESLSRLNERFASEGRAPIRIVPADELLETEDLLEMVNAGVIPITIADSHLAEFWGEIFERITPHTDLVVATGRRIGWAFRKNSPELEQAVNEFVRANRRGTLIGNVLFRRYLKDASYLRNPGVAEDRRRFEAAVEFFRRYGDQYDLPYLLIAAQAYQESRIDQSKRSPGGAVGVMQILPSTAADPRVGMPDIEEMEPNIHAGVRYLRMLIDDYFNDPALDPLNRQLLAFAAYNAGPARVAGLRRKAAEMGLDPNRWFGNVEVVAARQIGRETVDYVSNVYKYYIAYQLITRQQELKEAR